MLHKHIYKRVRCQLTISLPNRRLGRSVLDACHAEVFDVGGLSDGRLRLLPIGTLRAR